MNHEVKSDLKGRKGIGRKKDDVVLYADGSRNVLPTYNTACDTLIKHRGNLTLRTSKNGTGSAGANEGGERRSMRSV